MNVGHIKTAITLPPSSCEDCLSYFAKLPDESVDHINNDPPYFIGYDEGDGWDHQWKTESEYLAWCDAWTRECVRVLKPGRMLIVWGTLKHEAFLRYKLQTNQIEGLTPQNEIVWSYNWGGRSKTNFARKHEYAFCWSKGESFLFNADAIRVPRKVTKNIRTGQNYTQGTIPTCVWEQNNHTMSKDYVGWHPTPKNTEVLQRMILAYTNPGEVVLDTFLGSGRTAIAALRTGRQWLGCERDPGYFALMQEAIKAES